MALLKELEIEGVSTHSFRRTALTPMSDAGVPRWHIQAISGHKTLAALERYLGVTEQQKQTAISTIKMTRFSTHILLKIRAKCPLIIFFAIYTNQNPILTELILK